MLSTQQPTRVSPSNDKPIRVIIIEDLREVREGLTMLINGTHGFRCVSSHRTMEDALAGIVSEPPDVVLTDIVLQGLSGIDGTHARRALFSPVPTIAL